MSLEEYINNPMGKMNMVFSGRRVYQMFYEDKFSKVMMREAGHMKYSMWKRDDRWVIHFKVPSEVTKLHYDVVFDFIPSNAINGMQNDMFKYDWRVFSNDPRFVFTYAFVFKERELFIPELMSKMSKIALKKEPVKRNPDKAVGYVKAIYFAYLYMRDHSLNRKEQWVAARPFQPKELLLDIVDADEMIEKRQAAKRIVDDTKKPEKRKLNANEKIAIAQSGGTGNITRRRGSGRLTRRVNAANQIRQTKITGQVKRSPTIKRK